MSNERLGRLISNIPNPTNAELAELEARYIKNYHFDYSAIKKIDIDDLLDLHIADIPEVKLNSLEEDIALAKRIENGGDDAQEAREALFYSVVYMVISEASKKTKDKQEMMDLVQEGNLILWEKAIEKYDWRHGFKFSTYAMWWIRSAQSRYLSRNSRPYRVPEKVILDSKIVVRTFDRLSDENQHKPTLKDISEVTGIKPDKARELFDFAKQKYVSLSSPTNKRDDMEVEETAEDHKSLHGIALEDSIDEKNHIEFVKSKIVEELSHLIPRQREVLKFRLGIGNQNIWNGDYMPFEKIGKIMGGITRERVRQIQRDGLRNIKDRKIHNLLITILSSSKI